MNTDNLINELSSEVKAVHCARCPLTVLFFGLGSVAAYLFIFHYISGFREDITLRLNDNLFLYEIILSSITVVAAIIALSWQAFPDLSERKLMPWLPLIPLAGFILSFGTEYSLHPGSDMDAAQGMQCAMHLCLMSLLPAALLYLVLARGVFLHAARASFHIGLASAMTAYLSARLAEPTDDMTHLLFWHILPVILLVTALAAVNMWLLKRKKI